MLKAVIADDEKKVCLMIRKLIDWGALGYDVVGMAHSGPEAYDLIRQHEPEVVITDIRMPGFGGIELVKSIKACGLSPDFIIISGYKHFEYAHDAIRYGVESYLLKPIDKAELEETLIKIRKRYKDESDKVEVDQQMKNELVRQRNEMRRHFINDMIFNSRKMDGLELERVNDAYQLRFHEGMFQAVFVKLDFGMGISMDIESMLNKLGDMTEKIIYGCSQEYITVPSQSGLIFVVNYDQAGIKDIESMYGTIFERIQNYLDNFEGFSCTMGIGANQTSIRDVSKSISTAVEAVKCRIACGVNRVIAYDSLAFGPVSLAQILTPIKTRQLENIVETMDGSGFRLWVSEAFEILHQTPNYDPCAVFDLLKGVKDLLTASMKAIEVEGQVLLDFGKAFDEILDSGTSERSISKNIQDFVCSRFDQMRENKQMMDIRPIRLAKQYVAEHYMEPVGLEEVANAVHLNPSYFSTAFKKEVGMNFIDYLISCRLDAAKNLLKTTNDSMSAIAERIGYTDTKYFSKLFTKIVGIKPSEYRKLYS